MSFLRVAGALVIACLMALAGSAWAQTAPAAPATTTEESASDLAGDIALTRAVNPVRRQAIVTQAMDLEPKEGQAFWPLYREYRIEMAKVGDRRVKRITEYLESNEALSDDTAARMLDEYLGIGWLV